MEQIREYTDERLKGSCIHCGGTADRSRDHVPSKALLYKPYPTNLPTVATCRGCNSGFASDEEYTAAFMSVVLSGSTEPDRQQGTKGREILHRSRGLRQMIESSKREFRSICGEIRTLWTPEVERFENVMVKNARGHVYFEFGEPKYDGPTYTMVWPLDGFTVEERVGFETVEMGLGSPEVGSRMLTRMVGGHDLVNGWITVQEGEYRYAVTQSPTDALIVKIVVAEYLATEVAWTDELNESDSYNQASARPPTLKQGQRLPSPKVPQRHYP